MTLPNPLFFIQAFFGLRSQTGIPPTTHRCTVSASQQPTPRVQANKVTHYENFPVASWLCPPHLRGVIAAIYHFARTADDLADEGDTPAQTRLSDLLAYRHDLLAAACGGPTSPRWPEVFGPLAQAIAVHQLPLNLLTDLLDAFEQDVRFTDAHVRYADDQQLLDYCRLSANPIGRLLLHLYQVNDRASLEQSDHICSALQLINFWQDVRVDVARQRWYPSVASMRRFDVRDEDLRPHSTSKKAALLIAHYTADARAKMHRGAQLALTLPGRAGWELRLVVQGGLRILDKIDAMNHTTWRQRPKLTRWDVPLLLWRAVWMRAD